jgi:hypothetical protein
LTEPPFGVADNHAERLIDEETNLFHS